MLSMNRSPGSKVMKQEAAQVLGKLSIIRVLRFCESIVIKVMGVFIQWKWISFVASLAAIMLSCETESEKLKYPEALSAVPKSCCIATTIATKLFIKGFFCVPKALTRENKQ